MDFREVVSQMLGLNMTSLALPDYEIIKCLESLIHSHQHHFVTCACIKDVTTGQARHPQHPLKLLHWMSYLLREVELKDRAQFSISQIPNLWNLISVWIWYTLMIKQDSYQWQKNISKVPAVGKCLTLKPPIISFACDLGPRRIPPCCVSRMEMAEN